MIHLITMVKKGTTKYYYTKTGRIARVETVLWVIQKPACTPSINMTTMT